MGSYNVRDLSYIVAVLHIVGCFSIIVGFIFRRANAADENNNVKKSTFVKIEGGRNEILIDFWYFLPLLILLKAAVLIKGLKQKSGKLIASFLGVMAFVIVVILIWAIAEFFMELVKGQSFASVTTDLLLVCGAIVVELIILRPVMVYHNELTETPGNVSQSQHEPSDNYNPNKSSTAQVEAV